jgi:hypothetical protein
MTGRPPTLITEAQERRLVAAYKAGTTIALLSRRFHLDDKRVTETLDKYGVERSRRQA